MAARKDGQKVIFQVGVGGMGAVGLNGMVSSSHFVLM